MALFPASSANDDTSYKFASYIDISGYTSSYYTAQTDGYLNLIMGSQSSGTLSYNVDGGNGNYIISVNGENDATLCFIRKGLRMQKRGSSTATGTWYAYFVECVPQ